MVREDLPGIFVTAYQLIFERLVHGDPNPQKDTFESDMALSYSNSGMLLKGNTKRANLVVIVEFIDYLLDHPSEESFIDSAIVCKCSIEFCPNYALLLFLAGLREELIQWRIHLKELIAKSEYRFFITGSRDLFIKHEIKKVLAEIYAKGINPKKMVMVVGDAKGVDESAYNLWSKAGLRVEVYAAQWDKHGKKAGMLRNIEMLESGVDFGYGFCKDNSKGTSGMLKAAEDRGIPFKRFDY